jgi:hypothetical protein
MLTFSGINNGDCGLGNLLFKIAGVIGIATKNGYSYGFDRWNKQDYFVNSLPETKLSLPAYKMPANFETFDFGFVSFDVPDNIDLIGELASYKYFEHCEDVIRHYFTMKDLCEPYKDSIIMHYRDYTGWEGWAELDRDYYLKALKKFPDRRVVVITNNIEKAKEIIKEDFDYISNEPIIDLYLGSHAKYLVMANSTFSWWWALLSGAKTVIPLNWYSGRFKDCPTKDLYCKKWLKL